jgi:hypothetical protein
MPTPYAWQQRVPAEIWGNISRHVVHPSDQDAAHIAFHPRHSMATDFHPQYITTVDFCNGIDLDYLCYCLFFSGRYTHTTQESRLARRHNPLTIKVSLASSPAYCALSIRTSTWTHFWTRLEAIVSFNSVVLSIQPLTPGISARTDNLTEIFNVPPKYGLEIIFQNPACQMPKGLGLPPHYLHALKVYSHDLPNLLPNWGKNGDEAGLQQISIWRKSKAAVFDCGLSFLNYSTWDIKNVPLFQAQEGASPRQQASTTFAALKRFMTSDIAVWSGHDLRGLYGTLCGIAAPPFELDLSLASNSARDALLYLVYIITTAVTHHRSQLASKNIISGTITVKVELGRDVAEQLSLDELLYEAGVILNIKSASQKAQDAHKPVSLPSLLLISRLQTKTSEESASLLNRRLWLAGLGVQLAQPVCLMLPYLLCG